MRIIKVMFSKNNPEHADQYVAKVFRDTRGVLINASTSYYEKEINATIDELSLRFPEYTFEEVK